jgi:hypothetical protein
VQVLSAADGFEVELLSLWQVRAHMKAANIALQAAAPAACILFFSTVHAIHRKLQQAPISPVEQQQPA